MTGPMTVGGRAWSGTFVVALAVAAAASVRAAPGQAEPANKVGWSGDPAAPPFSGVWRLVETPPATGGSNEGWTPWPPPLKGEFAAKWQQRVAAAAAGTRTDDPVTLCQPPGMPRFITGDRGPLLILQTRGRVLLYRDGMGPRRAWLDGRALPG